MHHEKELSRTSTIGRLTTCNYYDDQDVDDDDV